MLLLPTTKEQLTNTNIKLFKTVEIWEVMYECFRQNLQEFSPVLVGFFHIDFGSNLNCLSSSFSTGHHQHRKTILTHITSDFFRWKNRWKTLCNPKLGLSETLPISDSMRRNSFLLSRAPWQCCFYFFMMVDVTYYYALLRTTNTS